MTLTSDDVFDCLEDERHNGYGLRSTMDCLRPATQLRLARVIADQANREGLSREELFWWTDHKAGRHLDVHGSSASAEMREAVRHYLNRRTIESWRDEAEALYAR
jgi:hypothetical protein